METLFLGRPLHQIRYSISHSELILNGKKTQKSVTILPRKYNCTSYMVSYEVGKFITSAEDARIYMEVIRFELER
jgi:hypothetical protein